MSLATLCSRSSHTQVVVATILCIKRLRNQRNRTQSAIQEEGGPKPVKAAVENTTVNTTQASTAVGQSVDAAPAQPGVVRKRTVGKNPGELPETPKGFAEFYEVTGGFEADPKFEDELDLEVCTS